MKVADWAEMTKKEATQAKIHQLERSCGCEAGSILGLAALIGNIAFLALEDGRWAGWPTVASFGIWVVGAGVVGKLIGLGWARLRIVQLRTQLNRQYDQAARPLESPVALQDVPLPALSLQGSEE